MCVCVYRGHLARNWYRFRWLAGEQVLIDLFTLIWLTCFCVFRFLLQFRPIILQHVQVFVRFANQNSTDRALYSGSFFSFSFSPGLSIGLCVCLPFVWLWKAIRQKASIRSELNFFLLSSAHSSHWQYECVPFRLSPEIKRFIVRVKSDLKPKSPKPKSQDMHFVVICCYLRHTITFKCALLVALVN